MLLVLLNGHGDRAGGQRDVDRKSSECYTDRADGIKANAPTRKHNTPRGAALPGERAIEPHMVKVAAISQDASTS